MIEPLAQANPLNDRANKTMSDTEFKKLTLAHNINYNYNYNFSAFDRLPSKNQDIEIPDSYPCQGFAIVDMNTAKGANSFDLPKIRAKSSELGKVKRKASGNFNRNLRGTQDSVDGSGKREITSLNVTGLSGAWSREYKDKLNLYGKDGTIDRRAGA
jgi:hypothetical protein